MKKQKNLKTIKVYPVIKIDPWEGFEELIKVFSTEDKARQYVKKQEDDPKRGCVDYAVWEMEVE